MHDLTFRFKRAHLKAVAFGRLLLKKFELTPARFDVLYVVQRGGTSGVLQSDIWETLGLHKTTISKMCKRLEQLGLVYRCNAGKPRHEICVQLTSEGIKRIGLAMNFVFRTEGPRFAIGAVMSRIEPDVEGFISKLRRLTERAARNLGDTSTLLYPMLPPSPAMLQKVLARIQRITRVRAEAEASAQRMKENDEARQKAALERWRTAGEDTSDWDDDDFDH